jgi:hypothetical protein
MRRVHSFPNSATIFSLIGVMIFLVLIILISTSENGVNSIKNQLGGKIAMEVFNAIGKNKTNSIRYQLSADLANAGVDFGDTKMNFKMSEIKNISVSRLDADTLIYEAKYIDGSIKRSKFVLDKSNELIEIDLLSHP